MTTAAGFEPARAKPRRFRVFLLNHSDKLPMTVKVTVKDIFTVWFPKARFKETNTYYCLFIPYPPFETKQQCLHPAKKLKIG